jgi:pimeloyl-ACP methyl ester carboxylesterase
MPSFQYDRVTLYYEEFGDGFPMLAFSPGGLTATISWWQHRAAPIDVTNVFSDEYRVIVMDQRNAGGRSEGPISAADNWDTYMRDHIAILDHLGIERCHLYGQCIGGPFVLSLLRAQPERFPCAVLAQPIGRIGPLPETKHDSFLTWANLLKDRPDVNDDVIESVYQNLYAPGFGYCIDREFASQCETPCIVLAGDDEVHPFEYAEELAGLLPDAVFIPEWKSGEALDDATERIRGFLREHTPAVNRE